MTEASSYDLASAAGRRANKSGHQTGGDADQNIEKNARESYKKRSWFHDRSNLKKLLIAVSIVWLLTVVILSALVSIVSFKYGSVFTGEPRETCLTPGCVRAASLIIESMNASVDPCDDFYQFACGGWIEERSHGGETDINHFSELRGKMNRKLRALIERKASEDESEPYRMMRLMYRQCINESEINSYKADPLLSDIKYFGGWPVIEGENWTESFDWIEFIGKLREKGYSDHILVSVDVDKDHRNSSRRMIAFDQASLGLDREYFLQGLNDSVVKAYLQIMVDIPAGLSQIDDMDRVSQEMKSVLEFEMELANITIPRELRRNFTQLYNSMALRDLVELTPTINWMRLVNLIFDEEITAGEEITVASPSYFQALEKLIQQTPPRTLANYFIFQTVYGVLGDLGSKYRNLGAELQQVLLGSSGDDWRWETCMRVISSKFGMPLSALYVRNHFDEESLEKADEMVTHIHEEFITMLRQIDWMDELTKKRAIEKAQAITKRIGYPTELLNDTIIVNEFKGFNLNSSDTYYRNLRTWYKYWRGQWLRKLREPYVKNHWHNFFRVIDVNAYYNFFDNNIRFPAAILQGIFFDKNRPNYLNYGAIGSIMGHEITHGFDDRGRQWDAEGHTRNWWQDETDAKFKEKAQCMIDQYSSFELPVPGLKPNGINTLGENIADNGGTKEAYLGYQSYVKKKGQEPLLPGLKYTPDQLFWISRATFRCSVLHPSSLKWRVKSGVHSLPRLRVIGPLMNSPLFARSFNCPLGSRMNPVKKCTVW